MPRRSQWEDAPEEQPGGPGASGPGEAGYEGEVTVGEDAGFEDPEGWSQEDLAGLGRDERVEEDTATDADRGPGGDARRPA